MIKLFKYFPFRIVHRKTLRKLHSLEAFKITVDQMRAAQKEYESEPNEINRIEKKFWEDKVATDLTFYSHKIY